MYTAVFKQHSPADLLVQLQVYVVCPRYNINVGVRCEPLQMMVFVQNRLTEVMRMSDKVSELF